MKIGDVRLENNLLLAPLAGFTDVGFRRLAASFGAGLTCTEMVSAKGLVKNPKAAKPLLAVSEEEKTVAVQIFGAEPEYMYRAARHEFLERFDVIDINAGCPVAKVVGNGEGSALLKDPIRLSEVVAATVEGAGKRPVTVKMRLGFSDGDFCADKNAEIAEKAGAKAVTVHGRTRSQFYSGEANYELIAEVKKAVNIPVVANGDVTDKKSLKRCLEITGADAVAIGRGALGRPWIFAELTDKEPIFDLEALILQHIEDLRSVYGDYVAANEMKKHICCYLKGRRGVSALKNKFMTLKNVEEEIEAVKAVFGEGAL